MESARRVLVAFVVELKFPLLTSTTRSSVHDFGGWAVYADLVCTMVSIWDVGTLVSSKNVLLHVVFGSLGDNRSVPSSSADICFTSSHSQSRQMASMKEPDQLIVAQS